VLKDLRDGRNPYQGAWREFEEQFTCRFIPLDLAKAACEALKKLKQGQKSVAEYKAKFDEQSLLTKWSQVDLRTRFYDELSDSINVMFFYPILTPLSFFFPVLHPLFAP
jgi:hypothetical protein